MKLSTGAKVQGLANHTTRERERENQSGLENLPPPSERPGALRVDPLTRDGSSCSSSLRESLTSPFKSAVDREGGVPLGPAVTGRHGSSN